VTARRRVPRKSQRRWCLPTAILRETDETLEGSHILDEHSGDLGCVLWTACRDVVLWSSVPSEKRKGLFTDTAFNRRIELLKTSGPDPELEVTLTALAYVVDRPAATDPIGVAAVCSAVSQWAADRGALGTAVAFAQAAALAVPENASAALAVGRVALRWSRFPRAETWIRRAIGLARRASDWQPYAEAYVDLGALYRTKNQPERSYVYYRTAARAGRRHGLLQVRGSAQHGLFLLHMDQGETEEAGRYARMALRAYGKKHPRVPEFMHDVAQLWIATESYGRAVPVLQRLLADRHAPADRAWTLALLAHAAAGAGEPRLYEDAWSNAWALLDRLQSDAGTSGTLLDLARAAAKAKDWLRVSLASARQAERGGATRDPHLLEETAQLAALAMREAALTNEHT
jgi:tetratricopeptide (TPR) repeat protein